MTRPSNTHAPEPPLAGLLGLQPLVGNRGVMRARSVGRMPSPPRAIDPRLASLMADPGEAPLSSPHDPAEREAESLAGRLADSLHGDASTPPPSRPPTRAIMRAADGDAGEVAPAGFSSSLAEARSGGRALPAGLRRHTERHLSADLGDVRVHDDARADDLSASISARAFTSGRDIFFRRGAYDPGGAAGRRLIAHELVHVAQARSSPTRRIHRVMQVGKTVYEGWRVRGKSGANVPRAWAKIIATDHKPAGGWTNDHLERLRLWITREDRYVVQKWMTQRNYVFADWKEAAEALAAEVDAQPNRKREKALAKRAKADNETIATDLADALSKIADWITAAYPGQIATGTGHLTTYADIWAYLATFRGQYSHWYPGSSVKARMTTPVAKKVSSNFVILREIVYALNNVSTVNITENDDAVTGQKAHRAYTERPAFGSGPHGAVRVDKGDDETRGKHFTPKAEHPWVQHARAKKMPLRAGASNTTDRILQMAAQAGVGARGKQAIAWGGFIFWSARYYKTISPPHTFHEIMDVAHVNHGVDYNVDNPYVYERAEADQEAPEPQLPQFSSQEVLTLVDKTTRPIQHDEPDQAAVQSDPLDILPQQPMLGSPTFTAGKTMMGSKSLRGRLSIPITCVDSPSPDDPTQLPCKMYKVVSSDEMRRYGRAQLQPAGHGDRSYFVALTDLFDLTTGAWRLS